MTPFTFLTPARLVCALGSATDGTLAAEAARLGKRPLLIHGGSLRKSGALEEILKTLHAENLTVATHEVPSREPTLSDADAAMISAKDCDSVLAIGGGSALDVGKCAALAPLKRSAREFLSGAARAESVLALPILAAPTTAGTGSEATVSVVFTDPDAIKKASFRGESLLPKTVILDGTLLQTCPKSVIAHSGLDAFVQAVESYISLGANPYTRALAVQAVGSLPFSLLRVLRGQGSDDQYQEMLLGSYLAGVALNTSRLGLVHGLAHPLGARTKAPHGLLCGLLMPHVLRFNEPVIGKRLIEQSLDDSIHYFDNILSLSESPTRLSEMGVVESDLPAIAAESMVSGSTKANPRPVSEADALEVLQAAL